MRIILTALSVLMLLISIPTMAVDKSIYYGKWR